MHYMDLSRAFSPLRPSAAHAHTRVTAEMVLALHGPPSQNGQMLFVRSAKALRDAATFFLEMLQNADVTASPKWMLSLKVSVYVLSMCLCLECVLCRVWSNL